MAGEGYEGAFAADYVFADVAENFVVLVDWLGCFDSDHTRSYVGVFRFRHPLLFNANDFELVYSPF